MKSKGPFQPGEVELTGPVELPEDHRHRRKGVSKYPFDGIEPGYGLNIARTPQSVRKALQRHVERHGGAWKVFRHSKGARAVRIA